MTTQSPIKEGKIGVLGGKGMLGSDLVMYLTSGGYTVTAIDRDNYDEHKGESFDVLVNANGNSRRFWANQNVTEDFALSTTSVYESIINFPAARYIYISSSDVYPAHDNPEHTEETQLIDSAALSPYGFHKYLSEQIVKNSCKDWLILRPSLILGTTLKKGPVFDALGGTPLFITRDTRLQGITTKAIAEVIAMLLAQGTSHEIMNVGGTGTFDVAFLEEAIGHALATNPEAQKQEYEMNVTKLGAMYAPKTSEEYVRDAIAAQEEPSTA